MELVGAKIRGLAVRSNGTFLTSQYNPIEEGERIWLGWRQSAQQNLVVVGAAPFYPIVAAIREGKQVFLLEEANLEAVRRERVFERLMAACNLPNPDELLSNLFCFASVTGLMQALQSRGLVSAKSVSFHVSPYGDGAALASLRERFLNALGDHLKGRTTQAYFEWVWHINALKQLLTRSTLRFTTDLSFFRGEAVLVGSGPSTESHLPTIKYWSTRAVVFAVPGMFPLLERAGIRVDFLVSGDGGYANHFHFAKLSGVGLPLIAPLSIYEGITRRRADVYYYVDLPEHKECLEGALDAADFHVIPMAGTSMNSVVALLNVFGFEAIRSFGVDFAITPFKFHANSNTMEELCFQAGSRLEPSETLIDRTASLVKKEDGTYTDEKLRLYGRLHESIVREHGIRVVSPSQSKRDADLGKGVVLQGAAWSAQLGSRFFSRREVFCEENWRTLSFRNEIGQNSKTLRESRMQARYNRLFDLA